MRMPEKYYIKYYHNILCPKNIITKFWEILSDDLEILSQYSDAREILPQNSEKYYQMPEKYYHRILSQNIITDAPEILSQNVITKYYHRCPRNIMTEYYHKILSQMPKK